MSLSPVRPCCGQFFRRSPTHSTVFPPLHDTAEQIYQNVAVLSYFTAILVTTIGGAVYLKLTPNAWRVFLQREHRSLWLAIGLFSLPALACGSILVLRDASPSNPIFVGMIATLVVTIITAALCYPIAILAHPEPSPPSNSFRRGLLFLVPASLAWSVLSVYATTLLVDVRMNQQGITSLAEGDDPLVFLSLCFFAMVVAILEEIVFRGGLISLLRIARIPASLAVVIAAFLFALGHSQFMEPAGVKEFQIFGLALLLGYARLKYGLKAAVIIHFIHNYALVMVAALFPDMQF
ncbi:CPBP family intramembrane metalloprotease [Candidatus Sumerlaeota bacterium]|nr:CPBP family intramembrane metalloprotease [Candidatus Sumerlaeota bacterium]